MCSSDLQEAARRRMREEVKRVTPSDIALAEQQMKECHENFQEKEKIQEMLVLFEEVLVEEKPALDRDHPIACYLRENDAMRKILLEIEDLVQYPVIRNQWHELYDRLTQFRIHLSRKQNQLYSLLEKKGFDRPTTIMWTLSRAVWAVKGQQNQHLVPAVGKGRHAFPEKFQGAFKVGAGEKYPLGCAGAARSMQSHDAGHVTSGYAQQFIRMGGQFPGREQGQMAQVLPAA